MHPLALRVFLTFLLIAAPSSAVHAQVTYETRALTGQPAPGAEPRVTFSGFSQLVLDDAGRVAFIGDIAGPDVSDANGKGIWSEAEREPGRLLLIARYADQAPGPLADLRFSDLDHLVMGDAGQVAFSAVVQPTNPKSRPIGVIYCSTQDPSDPLVAVARSYDPAPGTGQGVTFGKLQRPVLNPSGQAAFGAALLGSTVHGNNNRGIWSEAAGTRGEPALIARTGDPAPGTAQGVTFRSFGALVLSPSGHTAFQARLNGPGIDRSNAESIWSEAAGSRGKPAMIARTGDPAPGTPSGVTFRRLRFPAINQTGHTAFAAELQGDTINRTNAHGIWSEAADAIGRPALIARTGDSAPGTNPPLRFQTLVDPLLDATGRSVFMAKLTGADGTYTSVWSHTGGSDNPPTLIALAGEPAPGTEPGVKFETFGLPLLNAAGQTLFSARLNGEGINTRNHAGIWSTTPEGQLVLVIRSNDCFDVSNAPEQQDLRTISSFSSLYRANQQNGKPSSFNDRGQFAFIAEFTDGTSGVFVATIR
ncbi:MAG: choice-of-anchor tandem repeat NxxGxxAF-containing protein [Planctomycetota bacterium]